jgi:hypothetical protein
LLPAFFTQLAIDRYSGKKSKKVIRSELAVGDKWAVTSYNVCSVGSASDLHPPLETLPAAYRSFPILQSTNTCSFKPVFKEVFNSHMLMKACEKLFVDEQLTQEEENWMVKTNSLRKGGDEVEDMRLLEMSTNCEWVKQEMDNGFFVSEEEKKFVIAYAINLNQYPRQVLRLLRTIYRPHNVYCFHYDIKSDPILKRILFNVASCLGNVIISRKNEDVYWGWYTLEEAYFNCFSELMLVREHYPWRYVITLCGKELPLRTNAETVALLKPLNGMSSIQVVGRPGLDNFKFKWKWFLNKVTGWITMKDDPLPPIPNGLKVYKSWVYMALSHKFVEYFLCNPVGISLREYMKDVRIPEENYFAMLFMQPGIPGGIRPEHKDDIFPVTMYIWVNGDHHGWWRSFYLTFFTRLVCAGKRLHNICILSAKDLHRVSYRPGVLGLQSDFYLNPEKRPKFSNKDQGPLFHNRYSMKDDSIPMDCMVHELEHRNKLEYARTCSNPVLDTPFSGLEGNY